MPTNKVVVDAYLLRIALEIITKLVYPFQFQILFRKIYLMGRKDYAYDGFFGM